MLEVGRDRVASSPPHYEVARQLVVSLSYALLIVYAIRTPNSPIGSALTWWMNESAPWVQAFLFFEPPPSSQSAGDLSEILLAYRHVLICSLCFAAYEIICSRRYWPVWAGALTAKVRRNKLSQAESVRLWEIGFHRMTLGAIAATFLAIYLEPNQTPSAAWSTYSDWAVLRAPLLIGVATGLALLAGILRSNALRSTDL